MAIRFIRQLKTGEFERSYKTYADLVEDLLWTDGDVNRVAVSPTFFREIVRACGSSALYARVGKKMAIKVVFAANRPATIYCDPALTDMAYVAENDPNIV